MKALDTAVLLALLEGDRGAGDVVRRLRGHEIATTEANLLELSLIAGREDPRTRGKRRESIARLRRKMTVLPIDGRAIDEIARRASQGDVSNNPPHVLSMLGALEANGCDELITDKLALTGKWRFRVSRIGRGKPK